MHLWALALLVGLLTETATFVIVKWSAETFISSKVKGVSMAISSVEDSVTPKAEHESLDDIIDWANDQVQDIKTLRKKDSFRKEFIGNLAHELKTPLFNIQGFVLTLMENDLKDEVLVRNFLTKANKNVDRMTELIEDLDAISKLESDRIEMTLVPCNIVDLMREALENAEVAAEKKEIALKLELSWRN
jgi:two-component system phosphate regulon sensor histidine kinase PhoR